ncbi:MAG: carbamoyltransferase HypF [Desulfuromonas sp.]|nr:MAG: carbamoyltransferase HypF [Desulfuromonas sp.]
MNLQTDSLEPTGTERVRIRVEGIVQGVGFRPFVYQQAVRIGLHGWVRNDTAGVTIEVEGTLHQLCEFQQILTNQPPPLAQITSCTAEAIASIDDKGFRIVESVVLDGIRVQISPDCYVCEDCLRELFDPADRRFHYPFINCTNCGPRYSIVTGIPYDRPLTTMAEFAMCPACLNEYQDPGSRRFHAQPNACPVCGPRLELIDGEGRRLAEDPLTAAIECLGRGEILAVKGLGGYHLAVDATSSRAVRELRRRKQRDEKPFALMLAGLDAVRAIAQTSLLEERLLAGPERPIVLVEKRAGHRMAEEVAPDNRYFGVMLPYTPLHFLLLEKQFSALVMTSANLSDEPIAYQDEEARQRLSGVADRFLIHNRGIETRCDDSIARVMADKPLLLRRSRGYVPRPIMLSAPQPQILAVGAELKNTICLTRGRQAFLSQHIGDLKSCDVRQSFEQAITHLRDLLEIVPERVAHDLHPDYASTRYALEESGLPVVAVQHHHAHLASCLAEHGCREPAIGVIFDGIGFGGDGRIWGGEFLIGDLRNCQRVGHFRDLLMPGGDLAVREPWRMALSCLLETFGEVPVDSPVFAGIDLSALRLVAQATMQRLNAPLTSSCGRLFDGAAALLGLHQTVTFEGQAAMALEMIADPDQQASYPFELLYEEMLLVVDQRPLIEALYQDRLSGISLSQIAGKFHRTLAEIIVEVCGELRSQAGLSRVALSGGVFQNRLLTELAACSLQRRGFEVLQHSLVPPNDGGLALGQAVVAGHLS